MTNSCDISGVVWCCQISLFHERTVGVARVMVLNLGCRIYRFAVSSFDECLIELCD